MTDDIRRVNANGLSLPLIGQGGWNIGDNPSKAWDEAQSLRLGLELGLTLIDTAEMYGDGSSESLIGESLAGINRRDYQLVSKVLPQNADEKSIFISCEQSLSRLRTDYLDLYLLHWRGSVPLEETVGCMERLVEQGKILRWGVSNFDTSDMQELWRVENGSNCAVNQVLYNLGSRGIEYDLVPWLREHSVAVMAYCPLAQAGTLKRLSQDFDKSQVLLDTAEKYGISVMQLLLAFTLRMDNVMAIPKASSTAHIRENAAIQSLSISGEDWENIDLVFWPPTEKMHLDIE
ncbi:MAG: aldo/keto reductase [Eubacteriales bacterium]